MKLEGTLDMFPLRELLDMIVYSSVTGVLNIYGQGESGHIYVRESHVYHVERGHSAGVEALAELLELRNASFSFVSDARAERESLYGALATHLLSAERIAVRWRQIRPYVAHVDLIPRLLVTREQALRRAGTAIELVLGGIDGQTSIRQIAAELGWVTIDVAETVAQLSLDGMVEVRSTHQVATPHQAGLPGGEGLFDRIRTRAQNRSDDEPGHSTQEERRLRALRGTG